MKAKLLISIILNIFLQPILLAQQKVVIKPTGKLNYSIQEIKLRRSKEEGELSKVFSINSKGDYIAALEGKPCFEINNIFTASPKQFCINDMSESSNFSGEYLTAFINENGDVAGHYLENTADYSYNRKGFRFLRNSQLETFSSPSDKLNNKLTFIKVTSIGADGTVYGYLSSGTFVNLRDTDNYSESFIYTLDGGLKTLQDSNSIGNFNNGHQGSFIFGLSRELNSSTNQIVLNPWVFDSISAKKVDLTGVNNIESYSKEITAMSQDNEYVLDYKLYDSGFNELNMEINYKDPKSNKFTTTNANYISYMNGSGYKAWKPQLYYSFYNQEHNYITHGQSISKSINCSSPKPSDIENSFDNYEINHIAQNGITLLSNSRRQLVLVPSDKDLLPNYCTKTSVKLLGGAKNNFKVDSRIGDGYAIIKKSVEYPTAKTITNLLISYRNTDGKPIANASVEVDFTFDGLPVVFRTKTNKLGNALVKLKLSTRITDNCELAKIRIFKKNFMPRNINIENKNCYDPGTV